MAARGCGVVFQFSVGTVLTVAGRDARTYFCGHVYRHVDRHVCRHVYRHVYRHVDMCTGMCTGMCIGLVY